MEKIRCSVSHQDHERYDDLLKDCGLPITTPKELEDSDANRSRVLLLLSTLAKRGLDLSTAIANVKRELISTLEPLWGVSFHLF